MQELRWSYVDALKAQAHCFRYEQKRRATVGVPLLPPMKVAVPPMKEKEDLSLPPYLNGSTHLDSSSVHDLLTTMEAHVKNIMNKKKTRGEIIGTLQSREKNDKEQMKIIIPYVVDSRQNLNDARSVF